MTGTTISVTTEYVLECLFLIPAFSCVMLFSVTGQVVNLLHVRCHFQEVDALVRHHQERGELHRITKLHGRHLQQR